MFFTFPEIPLNCEAVKQIEKIKDEIKEYQDTPTDNEALDVLHACETFIRLHFKGRFEILDDEIKKVIEKNDKRGYYDLISPS